MTALGRHLLIELWGCNSSVNSPDDVRVAIVEAVEAIGATLLNLHVHTFSPQGVTGVAVLAESHMSIHTWPEHGYVAADVFTCGETAQPRKAVPVLQKFFTPDHLDVRELSRGHRPAASPRPRPEPSTARY